MNSAPRRKALWLSLAAGVLFGSCVTINIYFPAAAVEKAADRIIEETWGSGATDGEEKGPVRKPQSLLVPPRSFHVFRLGVAEAMAQDVDINVSTPAIRALKASIQQRSASLKPFLGRGAVGIGSDGMLVVRDPGALNMKEKAGVTRLVEAENADRNALYREIAAANNFGTERVADIKSIFARSWIRKAEPGWWVQNVNGSWTQAAP